MLAKTQAEEAAAVAVATKLVLLQLLLLLRTYEAGLTKSLLNASTAKGNLCNRYLVIGATQQLCRLLRSRLQYHRSLPSDECQVPVLSRQVLRGWCFQCND